MILRANEKKTKRKEREALDLRSVWGTTSSSSCSAHTRTFFSHCEEDRTNACVGPRKVNCSRKILK
jgi:hypothetical protein